MSIHLPLMHTEKDLLAVLSECYHIVEWKILGCELGVAEADLHRINVDEPTELSRQKAMFLRWFSSGSASWRCLVEALLYPPLNAGATAEAIAARHQSTH